MGYFIRAIALKMVWGRGAGKNGHPYSPIPYNPSGWTHSITLMTIPHGVIFLVQILGNHYQDSSWAPGFIIFAITHNGLQLTYKLQTDLAIYVS